MTRIQQCYNCFPHSVQIKLQCNHSKAHCTGQRTMSSFLSPFCDVGESGAWAWGETSPSLYPSAVSFTFCSSSLFLRGTSKSVFITQVPKKICRLRFPWVVWQMSNFSMDVAAAVGCVTALAAGQQLICLVSLTALKQKRRRSSCECCATTRWTV